MSKAKPPRLRRLAALLIRGEDARHILSDLDEAFERDVARGLSLGSARRRYAVNLLGSTLATLRATPWPRVPGISLLDLKLAVRMLGKQPGLTVVAVFTLALGIPIGLYPLHMFNSLTPPLPGEDGHQIMLLQNRDLQTRRETTRPIHDYVQWRGELSSFVDLGMGGASAFNVISGDGRAAPVSGATVTASVFSLLRVQPVLGRPLTRADEVPGAPNVVVIGHDLWQSRLAGVQDVIGTTIRIASVPHTVVGVMPAGFQFPQREHLWLPLRANVLDYERGQGPEGWIIGRLAEGVGMGEAREEIERLGLQLAAEFPDTHEHLRPELLPYTRAAMGLEPGEYNAVFGLEALALLMLVLLCGNVGILILARAATRSGEFAVRTALGASRARLVGQMFVESLLLAVLATGVGLGMGQLVATRVTQSGLQMPYWVDFSVTPKTVLLGMSLAGFSAVLAGVIPALKATGKNVQRGLQRASGGGSGIRFGMASSALIVAEVVGAVAFLSFSSMVVPSALTGPSGVGMQTDQYLYASLRMPWVDPESRNAEAYQAEFEGRVRSAHEGLVRRLAEEPGLGAVAIASTLPSMAHPSRRIEVEGEPEGSSWTVQMASVDIGYFAALEHPVLSGRDFDAGDLGESRSSIIVNTNFVDRVLSGRNPLGRRVRYRVRPGRDPGPWYDIVGLVGHLGMNEVNPEADAGLYHVVAAGELHPVSFAVRVGDDPESFTPRLRAIMREIDETAMIQNPQALADVFSMDRFASTWSGFFVLLLSAITIVLSTAGLYALMAFTVAQRTREIGIRSALGAQPASIVASIARRAFMQLTAGVGGGAVIGAIMFRSFDSGGDVIFSTNNWPLTLGVISLGMLIVGMSACWVPTRRGLRVRPTEALRS